MSCLELEADSDLLRNTKLKNAGSCAFTSNYPLFSMTWLLALKDAMLVLCTSSSKNDYLCFFTILRTTRIISVQGKIGLDFLDKC